MNVHVIHAFLSIQEVQREFNRITEEIRHLDPWLVEDDVTIVYEDWPTLFDGKSIGFIVDEGSQNCPFCGAHPTEMSIPGRTYTVQDRSRLRYGLTNLHFGIRILEFMLHVSYMKELRQWMVMKSVPEQVESHRRRKQLIYDRLFKLYGVRVDQPRQGGGTSNTGNVARVVFSNPAATAEALDLPQELIESLALIWRIIRSPVRIDPQKVRQAQQRFRDVWFSNFVDEKKRSKVKKSARERRQEGISWYYIPSGVHKVIEHLDEILEVIDIPPGLLSEEGNSCFQMSSCHYYK